MAARGDDTHTHTPHVGIGESCEKRDPHTHSLTSRQQWISGIISRAAATQNRCKRSSQSKVYLASCTPPRLADASNSKRNVVVEDTSATDEYHILVYSTCSTQRDVLQQLRSLAAAAFKTQEASSAVKSRSKWWASPYLIARFARSTHLQTHTFSQVGLNVLNEEPTPPDQLASLRVITSVTKSWKQERVG